MLKLTLFLCFSFTLYAKSITLHIEGITIPKGDVCIALYKKSQNFLHEEKSYKHVKIPAKRTLIYQFKHIPQGIYAIAIFHDENQNSKVDKKFLGIPSEKVGTSNNISPHFSAPRFKDAIFKLKKDIQLQITLK